MKNLLTFAVLSAASFTATANTTLTATNLLQPETISQSIAVLLERPVLQIESEVKASVTQAIATESERLNAPLLLVNQKNGSNGSASQGE